MRISLYKTWGLATTSNRTGVVATNTSNIAAFKVESYPAIIVIT